MEAAWKAYSDAHVKYIVKEKDEVAKAAAIVEHNARMDEHDQNLDTAEDKLETLEAADNDGPQEGELGGDDEGGEAEQLKVAKSPIKPSEAEVEEHRASGHGLYRDWCDFCVGGGGLGPNAGPQIGSTPLRSLISTAFT